MCNSLLENAMMDFLSPILMMMQGASVTCQEGGSPTICGSRYHRWQPQYVLGWHTTPYHIAYHIKTHTQCQTANTVSNTVVPHATVGDIQQGLSKAPSSSSLSPSPVRSNAGFDAPSSSGLSHKGRHFLRPLIVFA